MLRHLSTGSHMLAALMRFDRAAAPEQRRPDPLHDVAQLLAQQDQDEGDEPRPN
ncbi:hypothetical protein NFI95_13835 [Acetobacteraceae bacterium KSS8]|uniref:Uncharacterized protein n=1 Tax=Endosaccharibacter trunci TaxID=2812733 RepID=A0ABT1W9G2_9PROT|nr:hypothetical protein [Acetobacteraceae bacterium KSS8]